MAGIQLKLNDWPLVIPDEKLEAQVDRLLSTTTFGMPNHPTNTWDPVSYAPNFPEPKSIRPPNWPDPPEIQLNQLYWPVTGATRFAYGYFCMAQAAYEEMVQYQQTLAGLADPRSEVTLKVSDDQNRVLQGFFSHLYPLSPKFIFKGDRRTEAFYVVPVVDYRFFWQFAPWDPELSGCPPHDDIHLTWKGIIDRVKSKIPSNLQIHPDAEPVFKDESQECLAPDDVQISSSWNTIGAVVDAAMAATGFRWVSTPEEVWIGGPPFAYDEDPTGLSDDYIDVEPFFNYPGEIDGQSTGQYNQPRGALIAGGKTDVRTPTKILFRYWDGQKAKIYDCQINPPFGNMRNALDNEFILCLNSSLNTCNPTRAEEYADLIAQRYLNLAQYEFDKTYEGIQVRDHAADQNVWAMPVPHGTLDYFLYDFGNKESARVTTRMASLPAWVVSQQILVELQLDSSSSEGCPSESESESCPPCIQIPGVDFADLPIEDASTVDLVLAVKEDCLVGVEVTDCETGSPPIDPPPVVNP